MKEQPKEPNQITLEGITIRADESAEVLIAYLVQLLKEEPIKKYLDVIKAKKLNGTPSYTD